MFDYVFWYRVKKLSAFLVVDFDNEQLFLLIEEKPLRPKLDYVLPPL